MWFFGKKKEEKKESKEVKKEEVIPLREYVRINRQISVISSDIPGYKAVTNDISVGGVKLTLSRPILKGKIIKISLDLEVSNKPFDLEAEVMWVKEIEPNKKYEAGLRFIYYNLEQQQNIEKYILYILETQSNWYKTIE
jgi:c-di-GMP-binding flagellar brake protein YcgR